MTSVDPLIAADPGWVDLAYSGLPAGTVRCRLLRTWRGVTEEVRDAQLARIVGGGVRIIDYALPCSATELVTSKWLGVPGESASIEMLNGVETRRNLLPSPVAGSGRWAADFGSAGSGGTDFDAGMCVATRDAGPAGPCRVGPVASARAAVTAGVPVWVSMDVAAESEARLLCRWYTAGGSLLSTTAGDWSPVSPDAGNPTRLAMHVTPPAAATSVAVLAEARPDPVPWGAAAGSWAAAGSLPWADADLAAWPPADRT